MRKVYLLPGILMVLSILSTASGQTEQAQQILGRYEVKSIDFTFKTSRTYKPKRLLPLLSFKKGDYVDLVLADFGREDIEQFYRKKGFAFVKVTLDKDKLKQGRVSYTVDEGPRVVVEKVRFEGNRTLKSSRLKQLVKSGKKRWFFWPGYYVEEKVAAEADKIASAYQERGFLDCLVEAKKEFSADKSSVRISFLIDEGPVYIVDRIELTGARQIYRLGAELDEQTLRARLKLQTGRVYRKRLAESDRKRLLKLYREHGFINADIALNIERAGVEESAQQTAGPSRQAKLNVEFEIFEGRQFRIGRIDITGNKQIQDKVIRRILDEYEFQPGRVYNADVARGDGSGDLEKKIRRIAYTEDATITSLPGSEPNQKDVEVHVKEGRTGMWILGAGVGSDSGFIGQLIIDQRNFDITDWPESFGEFIRGQAFKGAGQSLRISLQPGTEVSEYLVKFNEPYFNDKPISQDIIGSSWERERESYDEDRLKGYLGFSERYDRRYRDKWRKSIGFRAENVKVDSIDDDAPVEIKDVSGSNFLLGLKFGIGKDLTDDRFIPTNGEKYELGYEQVTGEHNFGILSGTYRRYFTVYEDLAERKTVLATRLRAGTILGNAPPFEKFYAGGMYSIRGFEYRGVSTRGLQTNAENPQRKDPIGSDWLFLANAEMTVPLVEESLSALFFVDSGTVDSGSYRASAGGGIQILIPQWFGPVPMRFGVGIPFSKDDEDDTEAFFFSVGTLF